MFHHIPKAVAERMRHLEETDTADRSDGTPRLERLRQIPPETGRFIALLAAVAPQGQCLEIGTSAGYSTLWLALACRQVGRRIVTFEVLDEKAALAKETFRQAGVDDIVELIHGDARKYLRQYMQVSFCFLDAEKEVYQECYEMVVPNMLRGGIFVADNAINHEAALRPMLQRAFADERVDTLVAPVGKGVLVCRRV